MEQMNVINSNAKNAVNDIKIMEFIQDLKEAIQNGNFQQQNQQLVESVLPATAADQQQQSAFISANLNLTNVNNLSNQTFSYIISWLKQQQQQQQQLNEESAKLASQQWTSSDPCQDLQRHMGDSASDEIKLLKNQLCLNEREKDKLFNQLKEFQVENLELKTKLINLSSISTTSLTLQSNYYNNSISRAKMQTNGSKPIISDTDKDYEIDRLRRMIDDLVKSNEEKDKKIDELTKQVIRFKRIQEIVLSAQNTLGGNNKLKNLGDFDLDSCMDGSGANNYAVINTAAMFDDPYLGMRNGKMKPSPPVQPPSAPPPSIPVTPTQESQSPQSNGNTQQQQQQASNTTLIASSSLSSSISSASSNSSSSSSSSSSTIQPNQSQPQQSSSSNSGGGLSAPLATISELTGYNSSSNTNISLSNTSTSTVTTTTPATSATNASNGASKANNGQINIVMSAATNGEQNGPGKKIPLNPNATNLSNLVGSINAFNGNVDGNNKTKAFSLNSGNKYTSVGSINLKNSAFLTQPMPQNSTSTRLSDDRECGDLMGNKNTTKDQNSNGKGLRNFFGKLIRTSLVNINDSSLNNHHQNIITNSNSSNKNMLALNAPNINDALNCTTNNGVGGLFKRGGKRATANARLQNFSFSNSALVSKPNDTQIEKFLAKQMSLNSSSGTSPSATIDTLTFAKLPSEKVYDWLRKNGFDSYFTCNSDGSYNNKWIKNGLHLLQASQNDYEKELGIKNPLHRKRLSLLLQALYTNHALVNTPEHYFINYVDHHWVTKWLDDIGLPQYKDIFSEAKIDGRMLYHLNSEDIHNLSIHSELHYLSIKRAIHVLRLHNFDTQCLRRRPSGDERLDKSEVMLWTNHRIMEWLRSIDLSEYAPNLRGSGVHGGLMMFEPRFNSTVLADILSIPSSKTLLRRHLNTLFIDLIGIQMQQSKKDAESQPGYQPLNASTKLKHTKRSIGLFSHKRTKSQDSKDLMMSAAAASLSTTHVAPIGGTYQPSNMIMPANPKTQYSTLPSSNDRDVLSYGNTKLTFMNMGSSGTAVIQDNVPTSFV